MIKDQGVTNAVVVTKFNTDVATEIIKICDDLFTAESLSNKTDPELKRVAVSGIKRVMAGATDEITNTFAFDSSTVRIRTQMFFAGRENVGGRTFSV